MGAGEESVQSEAGGDSVRPSRRGGQHGADVFGVIALGGILGATCRWAIAEAVPRDADGFPTATFVTNVLGSLLLGFVLVLSIERLAPSRYLRPFLATGVLGAFTTFSAFAVENVVLVEEGRPLVAVVYVAATLVVGISAAWFGIVVARSIFVGGSR